ncbi:hypothetical protein [Mesorhizobium sp. B2-8-5]|uniref:hypothetical protein n=1 Tax=Mesorhizobium sp. B2-8-5 TaxID=2589903 RepID=UPI0011291921|nr:hypothetical protein [Mesorhizobium sp. B2-8-5]UCI23674.1 hypothetical protein FJ430_18845 [Mesorhizobium sp. B2-8-5]
MVDLAETIWRDFVTDGVPASGPWKPRKSEIRLWGAYVERQQAGSGIDFVFSATTTDADPGAGMFRMNNAAVASVTALYIDNSDALGTTVSAIIDSWDDSTNSVRGILNVRGINDDTVLHVFRVTGNIVDGGGYRKVTVSYVGGSGAFVDGDDYLLTFSRSGEPGAVNQVVASDGITVDSSDPANPIVRSKVVPVATRAALKALDTTKVIAAFFNGYYWDWKLGDYSTHVAADTVGGYYVKANAIAASIGAWVLRANHLSPKMFDAVGDDTADDTAACAAWFALLMFTGHSLKGVIDGKFKIVTAQTWDFSPKRLTGFTIEGVSGPNDNYLHVTDTTTSPAMYWHANGNPLFYGKMHNFGVRTNRAGVGFQIGQDNFADAWNQCIIDDVVVNNGSANAANVSLRLNHILGTYFNVVANAGGSGKPAQPGAPGYGTAVELRQVIGGRGAIHAGNSVIGHKYTGGYSYGNSWGATNIEEVTTAISCDVATASHNNYAGGYFVCSTFIDSSAGNSNLISNPNIAYYAGGALGTNLTGWGIDGEVANSVLVRRNATGISVGTGILGVSPAKAFHAWLNTGTVGYRWQSGSSIMDFDYSGDGSLTNYNGGFFKNAAAVSGFDAIKINSVEVTRVTSVGLGIGMIAANAWLDIAAGTAGKASASFAAGVVMTTVTAGAWEYDGKALYFAHAAASRGAIAVRQIATVQGATVALSNSATTAQNVFAAANDTLTVQAGVAYRFRARIGLNTGATSHTTAFGLGGSATFTSIGYTAKTASAASATTPATPQMVSPQTAAATVLNAASTAARTDIEIEGIVRVNAGGTIIPQVTFSAGPTGTCETAIDSFFEVEPIGANTVAAVGNWG